jgi:hypothetical protein
LEVVPNPHSVQLPLPEEAIDPSAQLKHAVDPARLVVPAAQLLQSVLAGAEEYFPAAQVVHDDA